jgi:hypothetical protein
MLSRTKVNGTQGEVHDNRSLDLGRPGVLWLSRLVFCCWWYPLVLVRVCFERGQAASLLGCVPVGCRGAFPEDIWILLFQIWSSRSSIFKFEPAPSPPQNQR